MHIINRMPLLWLSLAFLSGILLSSALPNLPVWVWLTGVGLAILLLTGERRWQQPPRFLLRLRHFSRLPAAALLLAVLLGAGRLALAQRPPTPTDLAWYNEAGRQTLTGVVDGQPILSDSSLRVTVRIEQRLPGVDEVPQPLKGRLLAYLPPDAGYQYGDLLQLTGLPRTPWENEDFSYRDYLERSGISTLMYYPETMRLGSGRGNWLAAGLHALRQHGYRTINAMLPQPEAALLNGILLGIESDIPEPLMQAYRKTGTAHLIAISGFNIAVLAGLVALLMGRLIRNRWLALAVTLLVVGLYTALVGGQASVVRAAIMGSMALLGVQIGRRQAGLNSLAFTAAMMCLLNPSLPWNVSFQLSFTATLGLVLFGEPLQTTLKTWLERRNASPGWRKLAGPFNDYILLTLAAQITTLPVIVAHFRRLSLVSLLANPLVLPPQPLVMILGGISLLGGLVWLPLGKLLAVFVWPVLAYTNALTGLLARLPWAELPTGTVSGTILILYYTAVLLLAPQVRSSFRLRLRLAPVVLLGGLGLAAALLWRTALTQPDGNLHVTLLNLPGSPALLVRTPGGETLLVDGGSSTSELTEAVSHRLPPLSPRLDWLLVTRSDRDTLQTLADLAERYPLGEALVLAPALQSSTTEGLQDALYLQKTALTPVGSERCLRNSSLEVCLSQQGEEGSLLRLRQGSFHLVWARGVPSQVLQGLHATVLVLGDVDDLPDWHTLPAQVLVLPQPAEGCPHCLNLAEYAWLKFSTDGGRMWVSSGK